MMFDWLWIGEDDDIKAGIGEQEDGVGFRRVRFYMGGSIYENGTTCCNSTLPAGAPP